MPKKRVVRTAKQRAASRHNLEIARGAKASQGRPMGKMVIGYHNTSAQSAMLINRNGFQKKDSEAAVFFSTHKNGKAKSYGEAQIKVKVPRKAIIAVNHVARNEDWVGVDPKHLKALHGRRTAAVLAKRAGKPARKSAKIKVPTARTVLYSGTSSNGKRYAKKTTFSATGGKKVQS